MTKKQAKAEKADALLNKGHQQLEKGNFAAAVRLWRAAAALGEYVAMHQLGYFYDVGVGACQDRGQAMQWYLRAFRRGCVQSAVNIGTIYRDEEDYERAFQWFNRAVALGEVSANFEIARVYMDFLDEIPKAVPYLRLVAKAKPVLEVSEWEKERAQLLLDGLAWQRKYKRASR
ncbi:MAG: tetratricopeptide repeat protein [Acidobacteriota bacterium]